MLGLLSRPATASARSLLTERNRALANLVKMATAPTYETLSVTQPKAFVYHVELNRPNKLNALNNTMWLEITKCFEELDANENCRAVVLSGSGRLFTAGLDLQDAMNLAPKLADHDDVARKAKLLLNNIKTYQQSMSALEICKKPVLAAVHSACIGAGVDMISAADIRYCTKDAWFQVKEVDIGMAADVGTLQRLPKVMGSASLVRELCFTARKFPAAEALSSGFVSRVFEDKESLIKGTLEIAEEIAKKSPVAVQTTKVSIVYSRDHTVNEGLDHIAVWNQMMLQSEDFANATIAQATKQPDVVFAKL